MGVENKVVIITGASSGIGEAAARLLARNGAKVVLGARRKERLAMIAEEIRASGGAVEFFKSTGNVTVTFEVVL